MRTTKELLEALQAILATMSISNVAKVSGVGEQTIRNWLNKTSEPKLGLLIAVLNACGHPIKFNFEGLSNMTKSKATKALILARKNLELSNDISAMYQSEINSLVEIIESKKAIEGML